MNTKKSKNKPSVCAITGEKTNLQPMHFKNKKGNRLGYIFLSKDVIKNIHEYEIGVTVSWQKKVSDADKRTMKIVKE